jgi:hypothetical protein
MFTATVNNNMLYMNYGSMSISNIFPIKRTVFHSLQSQLLYGLCYFLVLVHVMGIITKDGIKRK